MATKSFYVVRVKLEVEIDPARPESVAAAGKWLSELTTGGLIEKPEGMTVTVTQIGTPSIRNAKNK